jgi:hypothetical protein
MMSDLQNLPTAPNSADRVRLRMPHVHVMARSGRVASNVRFCMSRMIGG